MLKRWWMMVMNGKGCWCACHNCMVKNIHCGNPPCFEGG